MEKIQKEWQEKGTATVYLKKENLTTIASKLEKMTSLPNVVCLLAEDTSARKDVVSQFFMQIKEKTDSREKIKIVRDLLTLASFRPEINRITALREGKELPKNHVDFSIFKRALQSKGVDWNHNL